MPFSESRQRVNKISKELGDDERLSLGRRIELIGHIREWFGRQSVQVTYSGEDNKVIVVEVEPPVREAELRREVDDFFKNNPSDSRDIDTKGATSTR